MSKTSTESACQPFGRGSCTSPQRGVETDSLWRWRYAAHLGFPGPDTPYFQSSAGPDPVEQIKRAAKIGFVAQADRHFMMRPPEEQIRIGRALAEHGLQLSSFVDHPREPLGPWNRIDNESKHTLRRRLNASFAAARHVRCSFVTIVSAIDPSLLVEDQVAALVHNLGWAATMAEEAGVRLCLEPVSRERVEGALITNVDVGSQVVARVNSPSCRLSFDTLHVALESGDVAAAYRRVALQVGLIQIAERDRLEPGSGTIDFAALSACIQESGYPGIIELEHCHSVPGRRGEALSLKRLAAFDRIEFGSTQSARSSP